VVIWRILIAYLAPVSTYDRLFNDKLPAHRSSVTTKGILIIIIIIIKTMPWTGSCSRFQRARSTLCLKKTSPTFSTVTWKPIIRFRYFLVRIFLTQFAIKWLFNFTLHPTFVFALPGEITTSKISLFYPMRYDCLINITRKTHFAYISDTLAVSQRQKCEQNVFYALC